MKTTFVSPDGTTIGFSKRGLGPPLVLLHGTGADGTRWARVLPALEEQFTVFVVDRRGRGASGDASAYALEREVEDVLAMLESLDPPATLLGHSFGGLGALEAATRRPRLARLVLYEPMVGIPIHPPDVVEQMQTLLDAGHREAVVLTFFREVARMPDEQLALLQTLPAWRARLDAAHTIPRELRAQRAYRPDPDALRAIRVPVLLLLGGASPPPVAAATERLRAALPDARVAVLADQGHIAMDTAPAAFARALTSSKPPSGHGDTSPQARRSSSI
jgi:pimeloyl-ACP methyl ester carboxylesterase